MTTPQESAGEKEGFFVLPGKSLFQQKGGGDAPAFIEKLITTRARKKPGGGKITPGDGTMVTVRGGRRRIRQEAGRNGGDRV